MNNLPVKQSIKPIKVNVTRMEQIFESTNPEKGLRENIIKNYVYSTEKRVIA